MLAKRIIPCLDVTAGRVVKGVHFVNLRDAGDPVELADRYNQQGADELVFLDITASSDHREIMADVVARTARKVFIPLTVGGGIRSVADARLILMAGADKVSVNTAAIRRPELLTELSLEFGSQAVVLAIDAKRKDAGRLDGLHAGRPGRRGHGRGRMGRARGGARRRRNPADFHGHRRRAGRLRLRTHPRHFARHAHSGDRLGRSGRPRGFPAGADRGRSRRGAGGFHFSLRHLHRGRPQRIPRTATAFP